MGDKERRTRRRLVSGRLSEDTWQTLEAIRYLEERANLSNLVEEVLIEYAKRRSREPEVSATREGKVEYAARRAGKLAHIGSRKKSPHRPTERA